LLAGIRVFDHRVEEISVRLSVLGRPGSDLLFQALRLSTIGAGEFNGRVRDGIGFRLPANTTRSAKDGNEASWNFTRVAARSAKMMRIEDKSDQVDRAIRTGKLNALLRLHTRPINVVVYHGSV
jgi:hypothetical protein